MTREAIEKRLADLRRDRDQMQVNLHAYDGAIQDCEYWLSVIVKAVEKPKEEASPIRKRNEKLNQTRRA